MTSIEALESRQLFDAGEPDVAFGTVGSQLIDYDDIVQSHETAHATDFAQDVGGSTVIVGRNIVSEDDEQKILVMRIRGESIAHDTTFGAHGGFTELPWRNVWNPAPQVDTDSHGRIYVRDGEVISRLTSRGKLDATFGKRGKITVSQLTTITDFLVDQDDNLYVYGSSFDFGNTSGNTRIAVARFDSAGGIVPTWGQDGVVRLNPDPPRGALSYSGKATHARITGRSLQFAGTIDWITGADQVHTIAATRVVLEHAVPDDAYNGGSPVSYTLDSTDETRLTTAVVAILPDGTTIIRHADPVVTGSNADEKFVNARISADGATIEDFADLVPPEIESAEGTDSLDNAVGQDDGKYLTLVGEKVYRINRNGTLDTTWGDDGVIDTSEPVSALDIGADGELMTFAPHSAGDVALQKFWSSDAPVGRVQMKEITAPLQDPIRIPILWRDDDGIDATTLSARDIFVEHPDGHRKSVQLNATANDPLGRFAFYRLANPNASWNARHNGLYTIWARPGEVSDVDGNGNESRILGRFRLAIT